MVPHIVLSENEPKILSLLETLPDSFVLEELVISVEVISLPIDFQNQLVAFLHGVYGPPILLEDMPFDVLNKFIGRSHQ